MATAAQWIAEYDEIVGVIQTGQMPLAPVAKVTPYEFQKILDWGAGGFLN